MQCFCNSGRVKNLLVMLLRLNNPLKLAEHIPTPDCSGPAPTFIPFYSEYSTPCVSSTMPVKTPFCFPEFSWWNQFTSDRWRPKHNKLHPPEHLQVACQKNLTIRSAPRHLEPAQHHEFNASKDSVEELDVFPCLKHLDNITDLEFQPPPPPSPPTEPYPSAGAQRSIYIAAPWEHDAQGCLETNLQHTPY